MNPASFRDPAGRLIEHEGRLLRAVAAAGRENARLYLESPALAPFRATGRLIGGRPLTPTESAAGDATLLLEHERIAFASFAEEWAPVMLAEAAGLTLDLVEALLPDGLGLKDATPFNVLFRGPRPVFVDALSFERRRPLDPLWLPLAQFQRTFLLPLLAARYGQSMPQSFSRREGPEPGEIARLAGPLRCWLPPALGLATLPAWLGHSRRTASADFYRLRPAANAEQARYILARLFRRLRRQVCALRPADGRSVWSQYQAADCHYSPADRERKERFIRVALEALPGPSRVLDVGANLGHYSLLAARYGHSVVAIDSDPVVVGRLYQAASQASADVLPLVVDLAEPTPARGWVNAETPSFLDRARGGFDSLLLLAVIHHLLVARGIPLASIVELAASLTGAQAVVEFVGPSDPQFERLTRGREALHAGHTREVFEAAWAQRFAVADQLELPDCRRRLYQLRRRGA